MGKLELKTCKLISCLRFALFRMKALPSSGNDGEKHEKKLHYFRMIYCTVITDPIPPGPG